MATDSFGLPPGFELDEGLPTIAQMPSAPDLSAFQAPAAPVAQVMPSLDAGGGLMPVLTSGTAKGRAAGWARNDSDWLALDSFQKAAAMALMEADGRDPVAARNALGAMINRAAKNNEDLGLHVSQKIYQPTIEPTQRARLRSIVGTPQHDELIEWAKARAEGLEPDPVDGATHFLAHERVMERLRAREPNKYKSWVGWTGYDRGGGAYSNPDGTPVFRDKSHAFLAPEGRYQATNGPAPGRMALGGPKEDTGLPPGFEIDALPAGFQIDNAGLPPGFELDKPAPKAVSFSDAFGRGVDQMQGMLYSGVEATGELAGSKGLTEFGRKGRERNKKEAEAYGNAAEFTEIKGVGDFTQWAKETIGTQIPIMAPMLAGAATGAAVGSVVPGIGTAIGGIVGAFVPGFVMSTGEVQSNIKEKDATVVAPSHAFVGGAAIAALDSILPGRIGGALVKRFGAETAEEIARRALSKPVADGVIKRTAKGVATGMAVEGITEAIQEAVGEVAAARATNQSIDPSLGKKMIEAGAAGALLGGIMGPMGGGPVQTSPGDSESPPEKPTLALPAPSATNRPEGATPAATPTTGVGVSTDPTVSAPAQATVATPQETSALIQQGWSLEDVVAMPRAQVDAEVAQFLEQGGVMPAAPEVPVVAPAEPQDKAEMEAAKTTPKPAAETVRVYHGGATDDPNANLWFTTDRKYAEGYAEKTPGGKVSYLDLAKDDPMFATDYPEQGADKGFTFARELPAEVARNRQPLIDAPKADGSRSAPVKIETPQDLAVASERVAEPTEAQKDAGNYKAKHVKFQGLDITIENPKGSMRRGKAPDGTAWEVAMPAEYGYAKRSRGADGDQLDVYIGEDVTSDRVYVIDQVNPEKPGKLDEHKAMLGFASQDAALETYRKAFSDGKADSRVGGITEMGVDEFKSWLAKGKRTRPLSKLGGIAATEPAKEPAIPADTPEQAVAPAIETSAKEPDKKPDKPPAEPAKAETPQTPETGSFDSGPVPTFADAKDVVKGQPKPMTAIAEYLANKDFPGSPRGWAKLTDAQRREAFADLKALYGGEAKAEVAAEPTKAPKVDVAKVEEAPAKEAETVVSEKPAPAPIAETKPEPAKVEALEKPAFVPKDGWRKNVFKARAYAKALEIDHKGVKLADLVAAIDAKVGTPVSQAKPANATTAESGVTANQEVEPKPTPKPKVDLEKMFLRVPVQVSGSDEEVMVRMNAKDAIEASDQRIRSLHKLMECLAG